MTLLMSNVLVSLSSESVLDDPRKDPSLFPGHMEPLGAKQPRTEIETTTQFPSPTEFFQNYIDKGRPLLIKGAAKHSPAFTKWTDEYLSNVDGSEEAKIMAEPNLKEIRDSEPMHMYFKEFREPYQKEKIYMVDPLPQHLRKDVQ